MYINTPNGQKKVELTEEPSNTNMKIYKVYVIVQKLRKNYRIMVITFLCSCIITYIPHILRRIETWIQRTGDLNVILKTIEMY